VSSESKAAARERRQKARALIDRELERCKHVTDAWYTTMRQQVDDLQSFADDALADEPPKAGKVAADLFALWMGFQADACDLLHETYTHCLNDDDEDPGKPGEPGGGGTRPRVTGDVEFRIETKAEAADPQLVGVVFADRGKVRATQLRLVPPTQPPGARKQIPQRNVRVTTYGQEVFVSLVDLGDLRLRSGSVYEGELRLNSQQIGTIRVRVV